MTVRAFLLEWLDTVVLPTKAQRTWAGYECVLRVHILPHIGHISLQKLTSQHVQSMFGYLANSGVSKAQVRRGRIVLSGALSHAVKFGYVGRNVVTPTVIARYKSPEMQVFTREECARLLSVARTHRLYAAFVISLMLGLRSGEVLALRWTDIDFSRGLLHVRGTVQRQTGNGIVVVGAKRGSERAIHLPQLCAAALLLRRDIQERERIMGCAAQRWVERGFIFTNWYGNAVEPNTYRKTFVILRDRAGVSRLVVHAMRHTAATLAILDGIPIPVVSKMLGHKSIRQTLDTYSHVLDSVKSEAAIQLDELWGGVMG